MDSRQAVRHPQTTRAEHLRRRRHDRRGEELGIVSRFGIFVWGRAVIQSARFRSEPGRPTNAASAQSYRSIDGRFGWARQSIAAGKAGAFFRAGFVERPATTEGNKSETANPEPPFRDNRCVGVESFAIVGRRARFSFRPVSLAEF